ncbi:MAG: hypothetical protein GY756_13600 [bacterium]|nr:hypothetical protein [bacterium]
MLKILKVYLYISIFLGSLAFIVQPFFAFYTYKVFYNAKITNSISSIYDLVVPQPIEVFLSGSILALSTVLFNLTILGILNIYLSGRKKKELSANLL